MTVREGVELLALGVGTAGALVAVWLDARVPGFHGLRMSRVPVPVRRTPIEDQPPR